MNKTIIGLCFLVLAGCTGKKEAGKENRYEQTFSISTSEMIQALSSDEFEGRKPGTPGMKKATIYVTDCMKALGLQPFFNGSYFDTLEVRNTEAYNIVALMNSESHANKFVLIGAHLDHLGKIKSATDSVYNGANDNATGVTAVLQVANMLQKAVFSKKVIFALFTGEESGLIGSRHLAKRLKADSIPLEYVINFEMLGVPMSGDSGKVYITGSATSNFSEVANRLMEKEFIKYEEFVSGPILFRMSDNFPFYNEFHIPAHTISTFDFQNYPYYHRAQDEYVHLDSLHLVKIIEQSAKLIRTLLETDVKITLNESPGISSIN